MKRKYELNREGITHLITEKNEKEIHIDQLIDSLIAASEIDPESLINGSLNLELSEESIQKLEELAEKTVVKRGSKSFGISPNRVLNAILTAHTSKS